MRTEVFPVPSQSERGFPHFEAGFPRAARKRIDGASAFKLGVAAERAVHAERARPLFGLSPR
jgi:hypothetical protein